jgi:protein gp37
MLNEAKGNMYSWVTHTWNTIKGKCPHDCTYCYMHKWGPQKEVRFDSKELETNLGSGNFIFVGSSCDVFAKNIPEKWIEDTLSYCKNFDNTYLFQTKNPDRILEWINQLPNKSRICTTIETNRRYPEMGLAPEPAKRVVAMNHIDGFKKYVTIEPIMDFDLSPMISLIQFCDPEQVNIGADSGNNHLVEPPAKKILQLIDELQNFTVIDKKTNLKRLLNES